MKKWHHATTALLLSAFFVVLVHFGKVNQQHTEYLILQGEALSLIRRKELSVYLIAVASYICSYF